eukprot:PRCOL_00001341-RA
MRSDAGGRAAAAARHAAFVAAQQDKLEREAAAAVARRPGAASAPIHISDSDGDADDAEVAQGMPAAKRQKRANHPAGGRASGAGPDVDARHQKRPRAAASPAATHKPTTSAAEYNPWGASGYVPDNPDVRDLQLFTDEWCDVSLSPGEPSLKLRACLDTGNGGPTVISRGAAQRLGMLSDEPLGFVTMRGVVEGASERSALYMLTYTLKGKSITRKACVGGNAMGCELLISRRDIQDFEADGYRLSAK